MSRHIEQNQQNCSEHLLKPTVFPILLQLTWGDAQNYCEHHKGHLATFINIQDPQAVIDKIFEVSDKATTEYLSVLTVATGSA